MAHENREIIPNHPIPAALRQALWTCKMDKGEPATQTKEVKLIITSLNKLMNIDRLNIYIKDYVKILKLALFIERFYCENEAFCFKVEKTNRNEIIISKDIKEKFDEKAKVNVKFFLNTYPFDCCHFALENLKESTIKKRLNPSKAEESIDHQSYDIKKWVNQNIQNNRKEPFLTL